MMRSVICLAGVFAAIWGVSSAHSAPAQPLMLGALEENPGYLTRAKLERGVRVLFQKTASGWRRFPDCPDTTCLRAIKAKYPRETTWTIAFDGRRLGELTARTPDRFESYGHMGLQEIVSPGPIPAIGGRMARGGADEKTYRSLVAVSRPYYRDPQSWKPAQLKAENIALARQTFRRKYSNVTNCKQEDGSKPQAWSYRDSDLAIEKAYASSNGSAVVSLSLKSYRCDGVVEDPFLSQLFVISPGKEARWLALGASLVDAGDYDNDGKSELLFAIEGHNRSGYQLFYDDFRHQTVFDYSFH